MAKEVFERNSTGHKVVFFHWKSALDNEALSKFLGKDFSIQDSTLKYKGLCFPLQTHSYFYKSDIDDGWDLLFPEGMIKEYSYIGDIVAEEAPKSSNYPVLYEEIKNSYPNISEEEYSKIEEKYCELQKFISEKSNIKNTYDAFKFFRKCENFICELEEEYTLKVTKPFWDDFNSVNPISKDLRDVAELCSDFPFEKYIKPENEENLIIEIFNWYEKTLNWYNSQTENRENYSTAISKDDFKEKGLIFLDASYYEDGRILKMYFATDNSEYNPYC